MHFEFLHPLIIAVVVVVIAVVVVVIAVVVVVIAVVVVVFVFVAAIESFLNMTWMQFFKSSELKSRFTLNHCNSKIRHSF